MSLIGVSRMHWMLTLLIAMCGISHQAVAQVQATEPDPLSDAHAAIIRRAAAPLSDILNNRADDEDMRSLRAIVKDAKDALARHDSETKTDVKKRNTNRKRLLAALASVFDAIANLKGSDDARSNLTDAAIELELYVDDPDKHIAEAARLWQGLAYRLAGKPERSLKILHPILKPGTRSAIDLYGRFERCRALSAAGRHVAAVALAVRITEVAHVWPKGAGPAFTDAHTAARRLTADTYRAWAADLTKAGETQRAATAQRRAEEIDAEIKDAMFDSFKLEATVVGWESEENDD